MHLKADSFFFIRLIRSWASVIYRQDVEIFLACNSPMAIALEYRRFFGINWNITTRAIANIFFPLVRNACFSLSIFQIPNVSCTWSSKCINQTIIARSIEKKNIVYIFNYKLPINLIFVRQFCHTTVFVHLKFLFCSKHLTENECA